MHPPTPRHDTTRHRPRRRRRRPRLVAPSLRDRRPVPFPARRGGRGRRPPPGARGGGAGGDGGAGRGPAGGVAGGGDPGMYMSVGIHHAPHFRLGTILGQGPPYPMCTHAAFQPTAHRHDTTRPTTRAPSATASPPRPTRPWPRRTRRSCWRARSAASARACFGTSSLSSSSYSGGNPPPPPLRWQWDRRAGTAARRSPPWRREGGAGRAAGWAASAFSPPPGIWAAVRACVRLLVFGLLCC